MGEFEPKIVPKHQRDISDIEQKVISLVFMDAIHYKVRDNNQVIN